MDVFKTRRGPAARVWRIDESSFTAATGRDRPYRQYSGSGVSYYAFCPACDNPIQLIGLFRDQEDAAGLTQQRYEALPSIIGEFL